MIPMDTEQRLSLIREVGEEIITGEDLRALLSQKKRPIAYDGFEPSGKIHIAQGILRAINVNKMTRAGCRFKLFVADWHAWANNKYSGDLAKIQKAGEYMVEVWKVAGMDMENVEFVWASEFIEDKDYWAKVMKIATHTTLNRAMRCSQIMGRSESDNLHASQILYPCMQAADIFHLGADIAQLGMDQRKVNVLAREIGPSLGYWKPVAVHHHMLMGLTPPESSTQGQSPGALGVGDGGNVAAESKIDRTIALKMSKSKPDSAIFMTDSKEEILRKMNKAYCPEKSAEDNPVLEYCKFIVFEKLGEGKGGSGVAARSSGGQAFEVERPAKFGGNVAFNSYAELEADFVAGKLHPMDLKAAAARYIDSFIEPVRAHFEKNAKAGKLLRELNNLG